MQKKVIKKKIKKLNPISIHITSCCDLPLYKDLSITCKLECLPQDAKNRPLDKETIIKQISKTSNTPYEFKNIDITLDKNVFLPKLSILNELRRIALTNVENYALAKINRNITSNTSIISNNKNKTLDNMRTFVNMKTEISQKSNTKISVLLNILIYDYDYSKLENIDNIYIPLKYFTNKKYEQILKTISKKFDTYIYMPTVIKGNYKNLFYSNAENAVKKYEIKGFVVSNIGNIKLLNDLFQDINKYFKIIANYTFNVFNSNTVLELKKLGISKFTISPEADKTTISKLCDYGYLQKELIVYGNTPLLNMNYCLLRKNRQMLP